MLAIFVTVVALVLAVVRITSAGRIAARMAMPGRAASPGGNTGAVMVFPIAVVTIDLMVIAIAIAIAIAVVGEDGHGKEQNNDPIDELHLVPGSRMYGGLRGDEGRPDNG